MKGGHEINYLELWREVIGLAVLGVEIILKGRWLTEIVQGVEYGSYITENWS